MCFLKVSREKELDPWHVLLEWISPLRYTNVVVVLASCSLHTPSFELRCRIQRRQQQHAGAGAVQAEHRSSDTKYLLRLSFSLMKLPEIHSNSHQLQHFRHFWIFAMQYQLIGIVNRGGLEACSSRHTVTPEGTIFTGYTTWQCLELSLYIAAHQPDGETWGHGHNVHSRDSGVNSQSVFRRTLKIFLLVPIVAYCVALQVAEWHEMILNLLFQSSLHFVKYMSHFPRDNRHYQRPSIKRRAPGPARWSQRWPCHQSRKQLRY